MDRTIGWPCQAGILGIADTSNAGRSCQTDTTIYHPPAGLLVLSRSSAKQAWLHTIVKWTDAETKCAGQLPVTATPAACNRHHEYLHPAIRRLVIISQLRENLLAFCATALCFLLTSASTHSGCPPDALHRASRHVPALRVRIIRLQSRFAKPVNASS